MLDTSHNRRLLAQPLALSCRAFCQLHGFMNYMWPKYVLSDVVAQKNLVLDIDPETWADLTQNSRLPVLVGKPGRLSFAHVTLQHAAAGALQPRLPIALQCTACSTQPTTSQALYASCPPVAAAAAA